jgi:PAS domain S-box-containing protein
MIVPMGHKAVEKARIVIMVSHNTIDTINTADRAKEIFQAQQRQTHVRTDRMFAWLIALQWLAAAAIYNRFAVSVGSSTVAHAGSQLIIMWALAGLSTLLPMALVFLRPGNVMTRQLIAINQMLMSALLIYLSGGRIGTQYHVFGALAFLAYYRDWRVLLTATLTTIAVELWQRSTGSLWIAGVGALPSSHWLETAGWLLFEDIFLIISSNFSLRETWSLCERDIALEINNRGLEEQVAARTQDMERVNQTLREQIREREQITAALKASEERFTLAVAGSQEGLWDWDLITGNAYFSPRWKAMLGYAEDEIDNSIEAWIRHLHPDDLQEVQGRLFAYLQQETGSYEAEYRLRHRDGSYRWMLARGAALYDETGQAYRMAGSHTDITVRRQANDALRRSEERLNEAQSVARVGSWEYSLIDGENSWSDEMFRLLKYDPSENPPTLLQMMRYHPDEPPILTTLMEHVGPQGEPYAMDARVMGNDGSYRWMHIIGRTMQDEQGHPIRLYGTMMDITERKQFEEEQQKFVALIENSSEIVIMFDFDGMLLFMNRAGRRMLGVDADEDVRRLTVQDINTEESWRNIEDVAYPAVISEGSWHGEGQLRNVKTGQIIDVEKTKFAITHPSTGAIVCLASVQCDITVRKRATEELAQAAQELERRNRELMEARDEALDAVRLKSEFLANTSHEVRTPLNGIMGMTYLLMGTSLDERQQLWLQTIQNSAGALLTILNDILDFSKIEAGMMAIEAVPFSLREVVEETGRLMTGKATEKRVTLRCRVDCAVGAPADNVVGDSGRLRQVLLNLVGNAIKFTEAGGEVTVLAELRWQASGRVGWHLAVQDTGIGIPIEHQERIFESFTQADGSTTRKYGGTGLGLAICRQLVNLMGGNIGVESQVGRGSKFYLDLEFDKYDQGDMTGQAGAALNGENLASASAGLPPAKPEAAALTGAQLLLVEDNPVNQMVAREMLLRCGVLDADLVTAENGQEAIEAAQRQRFDLILMDMQMPDLDGMTAAQYIRARWRQENAKPVPIIALTAHCMAGDRERFLANGLDDYLPKPLSFDELKQCLHRWLQHHEFKPVKQEANQSAEAVKVSELLDRAQLALTCGNDSELEHRLLAECARTGGKMLARCQLAIEMQDAAGLTHWAHTLKGSCSCIGAMSMAHCLQQLEMLGKQGYLEQAAQLLPKIEAEWSRLLPLLKEPVADIPEQVRAA